MDTPTSDPRWLISILTINGLAIVACIALCLRSVWRLKRTHAARTKHNIVLFFMIVSNTLALIWNIPYRLPLFQNGQSVPWQRAMFAVFYFATFFFSTVSLLDRFAVFKPVLRYNQRWLTLCKTLNAVLALCGCMGVALGKLENQLISFLQILAIMLSILFYSIAEITLQTIMVQAIVAKKMMLVNTKAPSISNTVVPIITKEPSTNQSRISVFTHTKASTLSPVDTVQQTYALNRAKKIQYIALLSALIFFSLVAIFAYVINSIFDTPNRNYVDGIVTVWGGFHHCLAFILLDKFRKLSTANTSLGRSLCTPTVDRTPTTASKTDMKLKPVTPSAILKPLSIRTLDINDKAMHPMHNSTSIDQSQGDGLAHSFGGKKSSPSGSNGTVKTCSNDATLAGSVAASSLKRPSFQSSLESPSTWKSVPILPPITPKAGTAAAVGFKLHQQGLVRIASLDVPPASPTDRPGCSLPAMDIPDDLESR
ncbi:hypothetical protein HK102_006307 [Quaeritorhiza haematococci]|nr:hypothetical protein HK102_006307 [Quaeritorhiza haematococci]